MDNFIKRNIFTAMDAVIANFFALGIEHPTQLGPAAQLIILREVTKVLQILDSSQHMITCK